ncbi:hypothetical protein NTCA1_56280 [Novosphingobium sp. TCA1]|nr:hypothetical protein NTCA1_56280 [Novosphingobium sp. TCA1]
MANGQHKYDKPAILDFADNPVVSNAVAPTSRQWSGQCLSRCAGIVTGCNPLAQEGYDPLSGLAIELGEGFFGAG